jgi:BlaI family transcriptional regulator, penicillinase repressor
MARPASKYPTELELEILKLLWEESPLAVRDVRERLEERAGRPLTHSSVITMLNIMHRKGFLTRRKQGKSFLFAPKTPQQQVTGHIVGDLLTRLFGGRPSAMMLNLLETAELDSSELDDIKKLISRKRKEQKS